MITEIKHLTIDDLSQKTITQIEHLRTADSNQAKIPDLVFIYRGITRDADTLLLSKDNVDDIDYNKDAINVFSNLIMAFHNKFTDESDTSQKAILRGYVENLQIYLTRLQNRYNQLVYQKQQYANRHARNLAYVALSLTVVLSIISLIVSLFPCLADKILAFINRILVRFHSC